MREDLISKFARDKAQIIERLSDKPEFRTAVAEFCATTGLKVAYASPVGNRAYFLTPGGFFGGDLQWVLEGWKANRKMRYIYSGPFVSKEKASASSSRNQRDSEKITGILTALKRDDRAQIPTDEKIFGRYKQGIKFAFTSCVDGRSAPQISIDPTEAHALVEYFLGRSEMVQAHRASIESKYEHYLDKMEEMREARANLTRFTAGAKIIGIVPDQLPDEREGVHADRYFYVVGEASFNDKAGGVMFQSPLERYESLQDSPVAADAAIIRTYTGDKSWAAKDNELGIPMRDKFYDEIDIGTGYHTHDSGIWVVIPKNGA